MNDILVSVIVSIYNTEKYLNECIESAIRQTYSNIEIILVDDGSTDNCPKICDDYAKKDSRIQVIHKQNGGISDARNAGLVIAKGNYIYFLDSDDYIEPDAIKALIKEAEHYSAEVVFFDANLQNSMSDTSYAGDYYIRSGLYSNPLKGIDMLGLLLKNKDYRSAVPLLFIRRDILIENNLYFHKNIVYEDELFTFMLFIRSKIVVHMAEPLYNRRVRENSITWCGVKSGNFKSSLIIMSVMLETYQNKDESSKSREVIRNCLFSILKKTERIYYNLSFRDKISIQRELKEFKNILRNSNYLNSLDLKRICENIRIIRIRSIIKNIMPQRLRKFIKNVILNSSNRKLFNSPVLIELGKTREKQRLMLIGTPIHGNLGDHAIAIAENELFKKYVPELQLIEIVMPGYRKYTKEIKRYINRKDIIIISGGGWLGTLWKHNEDVVRDIVGNFPDNKVVIMPQTIYFEDTEEGRKEREISREIYSSHKNLVFCLRDKKSYEFVLKNKLVQNPDNCLYLPDMSLFLKQIKHNVKRKGILLCFRTDREKKMSARDRMRIKEWLWGRGYEIIFTSNICIGGIPLERRGKELDKKLEEYSSARLVITDRLHSMIFAAVTGTPCIAFDNLTGKVKGVYEWIKHLEYIKLSLSVDEAITDIGILLKDGYGSYDNSDIVRRFEYLISYILK
jgi:exopolysaccharide biosynthesis predicted pyruvyltransferase EpsI/glycosyltransferase involved in cell wall biosynthesis